MPAHTLDNRRHTLSTFPHLPFTPPQPPSLTLHSYSPPHTLPHSAPYTQRSPSPTTSLSPIYPSRPRALPPHTPTVLYTLLALTLPPDTAPNSLIHTPPTPPSFIPHAHPASPQLTLSPSGTHILPPQHSTFFHTHRPPFLTHPRSPRFPAALPPPPARPGPPSGDVSQACTNGCGASRPPLPRGPGSRRGGRPGGAHSRWRAGDWALKSGGGGSEEAPLSSVTSAAAAAAVAVAAAAMTPPQPRRATPGPARRRRRRRRVSTSPSCCCCCGRRCVSCCRHWPRCRRCPVASPRTVPGRRCRSSRYRTDDG